MSFGIAGFKWKQINTALIQCYAPTNDADEVSFYKTASGGGVDYPVPYLIIVMWCDLPMRLEQWMCMAVDSWMRTGRSWLTSALSTTLLLVACFFHTVASTNWTGVPLMAETISRLTTWWSAEHGFSSKFVVIWKGADVRRDFHSNNQAQTIGNANQPNGIAIEKLKDSRIRNTFSF